MLPSYVNTPYVFIPELSQGVITNQHPAIRTDIVPSAAVCVYVNGQAWKCKVCPARRRADRLPFPGEMHCPTSLDPVVLDTFWSIN